MTEKTETIATETEGVSQAEGTEQALDKELSKVGFRDPDQAELELKMVKDINAMPEEVQSRFKAMKVLYDRVNQVEEEEEKEYRQLELKYEKMYQQVYAKRVALLSGKADLSDELIKKFD